MPHKLAELRPTRVYALLLSVFLIAYLWRATSLLWFAPVSDHVSNFAITGLAVMLLITPKDFKLKSSRTKVLQILITFAVANIVIEVLNIGNLNLPGLTFISFNTADVFDAIYGCVAVILVGYLYWKYAK